MKKIVITGGLGYIGTELCKIYSGYSWNDKITVIDNRFISERVNQIRNWNMNFIHGDILNKDLIKKYCHDADIVHHLAGITDVPRVKSESSEEKNELISKVAVEGTQNILKNIESKRLELKIILMSKIRINPEKKINNKSFNLERENLFWNINFFIFNFSHLSGLKKYNSKYAFC